jgi:hypothetical protein
MSTDTRDDLVTEEMVAEAWSVHAAASLARAQHPEANAGTDHRAEIRMALRAVAPMIAERALALHYDAIAADSQARLDRAAAIRARGET